MKLNRANALLLKIRNYVVMNTLRNVYFAIFDSHLSYCCIACAQNINTVRGLTIVQKKTLLPLFSSNNILKFGDKNTLENILFVSKSINKQVPSIFRDLSKQFWCLLYSTKTQSCNWVLKLNLPMLFCLVVCFCFCLIAKLLEFIYSSIFSNQN